MSAFSQLRRGQGLTGSYSSSITRHQHPDAPWASKSHGLKISLCLPAMFARSCLSQLTALAIGHLLQVLFYLA